MAAPSWRTFWFVLPSLLLFVALAALLEQGLGFTWSLTLAIVATLVDDGAMLLTLSLADIKIS